MSRRWLFRITRRSMNGTALDEDTHENDETNAHQAYGPPVLGHPLCDCGEGFLIEEHILKPGERTLSVDCSTFEENIAVALKVVAGRARAQTNATLGQINQVSELAGTAASRGVCAVLTG